MGILHLIDRRNFVKLGTAILSSDTGRVVQVKHRIITTAQHNALMTGGQETTTPETGENRLTRILTISLREKHHVGWHVLVTTSQSVACPGAGTRLAGDL